MYVSTIFTSNENDDISPSRIFSNTFSNHPVTFFIIAIVSYLSVGRRDEDAMHGENFVFNCESSTTYQINLLACLLACLHF